MAKAAKRNEDIKNGEVLNFGKILLGFVVLFVPDSFFPRVLSFFFLMVLVGILEISSPKNHAAMVQETSCVGWLV